jgi:hypothetical protein
MLWLLILVVLPTLVFAQAEAGDTDWNAWGNIMVIRSDYSDTMKTGMIAANWGKYFSAKSLLNIGPSVQYMSIEDEDKLMFNISADYKQFFSEGTAPFFAHVGLMMYDLTGAQEWEDYSIIDRTYAQLGIGQRYFASRNAYFQWTLDYWRFVNSDLSKTSQPIVFTVGFGMTLSK